MNFGIWKFLAGWTLLSGLTVPLAVEAAGAGKHLFILSGQSNMERLIHRQSFTPAVAAAFGKDNVIVVKDAMTGQPIRRWYKEWKAADGTTPADRGDLYDRLMDLVWTAISNREIATVTFVWVQGEFDARTSHGEVYAASLRGLYDQLCRDLGRDDINFVIGRLSDFGLTDARYPHWAMVQAAQESVAASNPRFALVVTDAFNDIKDPETGEMRNDLHYSREGYIAFGRELANVSIDLIKKNAATADTED